MTCLLINKLSLENLKDQFICKFKYLRLWLVKKGCEYVRIAKRRTIS